MQVETFERERLALFRSMGFAGRGVRYARPGGRTTDTIGSARAAPARSA